MVEEKESNHLKDMLSSVASSQKDKKTSTISEDEDKLKIKNELNNEIDEDNLLDLKRIKAEKDAKNSQIRDKKAVFVEEDEDEDDWNMLPPFLRKKK
jgi:hypothetical protein